MNGGEGTELIIGGPEDETATDGGFDPGEVDVYDLGAGNDKVVSGIGGLPNPDRVSLGDGNDRLW